MLGRSKSDRLVLLALKRRVNGQGKRCKVAAPPQTRAGTRGRRVLTSRPHLSTDDADCSATRARWTGSQAATALGTKRTSDLLPLTPGPHPNAPHQPPSTMRRAAGILKQPSPPTLRLSIRPTPDRLKGAARHHVMASATLDPATPPSSLAPLSGGWLLPAVIGGASSPGQGWLEGLHSGLHGQGTRTIDHRVPIATRRSLRECARGQGVLMPFP